MNKFYYPTNTISSGDFPSPLEFTHETEFKTQEVKGSHRLSVLVLIFGCLLFSSTAFAQQLGGNSVFEFVNLPSSARVTALGGNLITVKDDDVSLAFHNPAAANKLMHGSIAFNHNLHFSDISNGYVAYGHHVDKWNTSLHAGLQYINYGDFNRTDETGTLDGTFSAGEYAFTLGAGYELYEKVSVGANLKYITSNFENYTSTGLVGDVSAMYIDTSRRFTATLLLRNLGGQLTAFDQVRESIPYETQLGISTRLKHLPFRLSVIYHNLNRWNIRFDDPNAEEAVVIIGEDPSSSDGIPFLDNLARHFIFNGEFLFGQKENFRLRMGYNHIRQRESQITNLRSFAGFSFGVGFKVNRFRVDFGRGLWHLAGGTNHFSISTNLKEFTKRNQ